jgi:ribosomal protein S18 acetylase RimI-like enzyme
MAALIIREAELSDLPYFYEICLKTGDAGKDASGLFYDPFILGQYYAAPYLFFERGFCFVAEADGVPQGYAAGAPDTHSFNRRLECEWLPPLRRRYRNYPRENIKTDVEKHAIALFYKNHEAAQEAALPWYKTHPAHLHIDLLPSVQGKGHGGALMGTLLAALARHNARGVHLGVSRANTRAAAFYRNKGFTVLHEEDWGLVMGAPL